MITGKAQVVFLKNFRSIGKCHKSSLLRPMALLEDAATIKLIVTFQILEWRLQIADKSKIRNLQSEITPQLVL